MPVAASSASREAAPRLARDLLALGKPHITLLSMLTGAAGMWLAPGPPAAWSLTVPLLIGLGLLVAGANALNQYLERDTDLLMERTRLRPLPDRRLRPATALLAGLVAAGAGLLVLGTGANLLTGLLGALALNLYVLVYTPLKRVTPRAVLIGAVPGAMPALMGWTAATFRIDLPGLALFLVLALWQVPHFLAIAMFRREDYARAGIRTLVAVHGEGVARRRLVLYTGGLVLASLLLPASGAAGWIALTTALLLGAAIGLFALGGLRPAAGPGWPRRFFRMTLVYLPALLLSLGVERVLR